MGNNNKPWIYWPEECKVCASRHNCPYIEKTEEFRKNLLEFQKGYKGVYGTLKFNCDYFNLDKDEYNRLTQGECECRNHCSCY